ncbi:unnamed protein product, partial [Mesorhabditis spiculigera]
MDDDTVTKQIEPILVDEAQPCSIVRLSRRANCPVTQASRCLAEFYSVKKNKLNGLEAVHLIKGFAEREGIAAEVIKLVRASDLRDELGFLTTALDQGIYALSIGRIEDLPTLLRSDHLDTPKYLFLDPKLSCVDGEDLASEFRSKMSATNAADRESAMAAREAFVLEQEKAVAASMRKKDRGPPTIQKMFAKARMASPQKARPPARTSPAKPPSVKSDEDVESEEEPETPPPPKKRGAKRVIVSDSEDSYDQAPTTSKTKTPVKKTAEPSSYDDIFDANDSSPEKSAPASPEIRTPPKKRQKKPEASGSKKGQAKLDGNAKKMPSQDSSSPDRMDTTMVQERGSKKKTVLVHGQETVMDEDGYLVTRPAMVEKEVDEESEAAEEAKKKETRTLKPAGNVPTSGKPAAAAAANKASKPAGQRGIASFFQKK